MESLVASGLCLGKVLSKKGHLSLELLGPLPELLSFMCLFFKQSLDVAPLSCHRVYLCLHVIYPYLFLADRVTDLGLLCEYVVQALL